jgi:hypothetical protein
MLSSQVGGNTVLDGKTQTVYTTSDKTTHFMSPIGSLQLTAEECNEILMKRAVAAVQNQQAITTTASDVHNARKSNIISLDPVSLTYFNIVYSSHINSGPESITDFGG